MEDGVATSSLDAWRCGARLLSCVLRVETRAAVDAACACSAWRLPRRASVPSLGGSRMVERDLDQAATRSDGRALSGGTGLLADACRSRRDHDGDRDDH